jgi:UDP-N-acetylmuramyl pentapeptide phosphotransferase/UDP-N-acetylglucosamine-1-phosphate transferase
LIASACCYLCFASDHYRIVAVCGAFISLLGFLDDRVQLRPLVKFGGQSVAVVIVIANGVVFRATPWEWANLAVTFLWIAGITNAFNLIDNMDGLCAGVAVIICCSRFLLALRNYEAGGALLLAIPGATHARVCFSALLSCPNLPLPHFRHSPGLGASPQRRQTDLRGRP